MDVPDEFHQLCISFYPRSDEEYATEDAWIAGTVKFFRGERKKVLEAFLDELLSGRYSDAEIESVWKSTSICGILLEPDANRHAPMRLVISSFASCRLSGAGNGPVWGLPKWETHTALAVLRSWP